MRVRSRCRTGAASMLAAVLITGSGSASETPTAAPEDEEAAERCAGPVHREFDFWLGAWEVRDAEGKLLGHNRVERVAGGCALLENWHSAGGGHGMSINTYDSELGKWTQRWVGEGATLWLEGGLEDGRMVLAGTSPRSTSGGGVLDRITWTPLPDGTVSQLWELSSDDGETWRAVFLGHYSAGGKERGAASSGSAAAGEPRSDEISATQVRARDRRQ